MSKPTLGIIGGGQLGSMLAIAANKLEIKTIIFLMTLMLQHKIFQMNSFMEITIIKIRLMNLLTR